MTYVLGLDVGGTKLAAGVVSADGTVCSFVREPTRVADGPDVVVDRLVGLARRALAVADRDVTAVGIGCGGPLDADRGVVLGPPGLPGWDHVPLVARVRDALGLPAYLDNDGAAAAWGEYRFGPWSHVRHLVYLTVSTGVGGGIVIDGRLYRGASGNGGELGHVVVDHTGRPCGCGQRGCAEAYVSGPAIARRAAEAVRAEPGSSLAALPTITAKDVADAARAGDPVATRIWDETTAILGRVVAVVINVFSPEVVVLGGGVTEAGAMLLDPVREAALRQAMPPAAAAAQVVTTSHGNTVGVVGAAAIALERAP